MDEMDFADRCVDFNQAALPLVGAKKEANALFPERVVPSYIKMRPMTALRTAWAMMQAQSSLLFLDFATESASKAAYYMELLDDKTEDLAARTEIALAEIFARDLERTGKARDFALPENLCSSDALNFAKERGLPNLSAMIKARL